MECQDSTSTFNMDDKNYVTEVLNVLEFNP